MIALLLIRRCCLRQRGHADAAASAAADMLMLICYADADTPLLIIFRR